MNAFFAGISITMTLVCLALGLWPAALINAGAVFLNLYAIGLSR